VGLTVKHADWSMWDAAEGTLHYGERPSDQPLVIPAWKPKRKPRMWVCSRAAARCPAPAGRRSRPAGTSADDPLAHRSLPPKRLTWTSLQGIKASNRSRGAVGELSRLDPRRTLED